MRDTEKAHKAAQTELEQMREQMEQMEDERAQMIAEVEAQIERALAHMAVDAEDSDYGGSRPSSRMSSRSAPSTFRRSERSRTLGSFSTESTLAESLDALDLEPRVRATGTVPEEDEEEVCVLASWARLEAEGWRWREGASLGALFLDHQDVEWEEEAMRAGRRKESV